MNISLRCPELKHRFQRTSPASGVGRGPLRRKLRSTFMRGNPSSGRTVPVANGLAGCRATVARPDKKRRALAPGHEGDAVVRGEAPARPSWATQARCVLHPAPLPLTRRIKQYSRHFYGTHQRPRIPQPCTTGHASCRPTAVRRDAIRTRSAQRAYRPGGDAGARCAGSRRPGTGADTRPAVAAACHPACPWPPASMAD